MHSKRIMIFGRPGSGKSTFAVILYKATGIPLYHLDKYFYVQNWVERNYTNFLDIQQTMVTQDSWIIDGNSTKSLEMRWARADVVLYFNYPRWLCYWRVFKRLFSSDPHIDDRAEGCLEKMSWGLLKYMWSFEQRVNPIIATLQHQYPNATVYEICYDNELKALYKKVFSNGK